MTLKPRISVLFERGGCHFWRLYQPCKAMQEQGLATVHYVELRTTSKSEIAKILQDSDYVFTLGLMDTDTLALVKQWQRLGLKVVIDYDDLHFNVSPFNIAYRRFGMEDVEVRDPSTGDIKYLWKDGTNGFDIKRNKIAFHCYKEMLKTVDKVITTTVYLKDAMLEIQPEANIKVIPNAINLKEWKPLDIRAHYPQKFRFGWAVSGSHGEDWIFIRPALIKFLKEHPDALFVCIGDTYMDIKEGMKEVKNQIEWYPFSDLWEGHYSYRMPMLGLDCAIAPLANIEFNKCKSPLKFAEYTSFGWPVIAQKMIPYTECMLNGHNGLLAETLEDWDRCLISLYNDVELRRKLHFEALFTVKSLFDLKEVAKEYIEVFKE